MHRFFVICYWLVPLVVIVAILATGIFITIKLQPQPGDLEERASFQKAPSASLSSMGQSQVLEAYLQAIGGRDVLLGINSARHEGILRSGGSERDFQLILSRPDKGSLVFEPGTSMSERYLLNGEIAWQVIETVDGGRSIERLGKSDTDNMVLTCRLFDPLAELGLGGRGLIVYVAETLYDGFECLRVTKERVDGSLIECYLDRDSLYLLVTEDSYIADGERVTRKITYADHRMTEGVVRPFETATYLNGELLNETFLTSIRMNTGVISTLFKVPEEIASK